MGLWVFALLPVLALAATACDKPRPAPAVSEELRVDPAFVDLGWVRMGATPPSWNVLLTNTSERSLNVRSVTSCGCSRVVPEELVLLPHTKASLRLEFTPVASETGKIIDVRFMERDSGRALGAAQVQYMSAVPLSTDLQQAVIDVPRGSQSVSWETEIRNREKRDVSVRIDVSGAVTSFLTPAANELRLRPLSGGDFSLNATYPGAKTVRGTISFVSGNDVLLRLPVLVRGVDSYSVLPSALAVRLSPKNNTRSWPVRIARRDGNPLAVSSMRLVPECDYLEPKAPINRESQSVEVLLVAKDGEPPWESYSGHLHIETTSDDAAEVEPIQVVFLSDPRPQAPGAQAPKP